MFRRFFETQDLCSSFLPWVAFQDLSQGRRKFANFGKKLSVFPPWLRGCTRSFWRPFAPKFLRPNSSISLLPPQALKTLKLSEWLFHVFASFTGFVSYLSYLFIMCFDVFLVCCLYPFIYFSRMRSEGFPFIVGVWGWTCVRFVLLPRRRVVVASSSPTR